MTSSLTTPLAPAGPPPIRTPTVRDRRVGAAHHGNAAVLVRLVADEGQPHPVGVVQVAVQENGGRGPEALHQVQRVVQPGLPVGSAGVGHQEGEGRRLACPNGKKAEALPVLAAESCVGVVGPDDAAPGELNGLGVVARATVEVGPAVGRVTVHNQSPSR